MAGGADKCVCLAALDKIKAEARHCCSPPLTVGLPLLALTPWARGVGVNNSVNEMITRRSLSTKIMKTSKMIMKILSLVNVAISDLVQL